MSSFLVSNVRKKKSKLKLLATKAKTVYRKIFVCYSKFTRNDVFIFISCREIIFATAFAMFACRLRPFVTMANYKSAQKLKFLSISEKSVIRFISSFVYKKRILLNLAPRKTFSNFENYYIKIATFWNTDWE